MKFDQIYLAGVYLIEIVPFIDMRGMFVRTFCKNEFKTQNLTFEFVQCNLSRSREIYSLRGLHYQIGPSAEVKLVRCSRGRIQDVIIDLRKDSLTYCQHFSVELSETNNKMLYVPEGFAHGFLTLEEDCEINYMVSNYYSAENERGIRWNDPAFRLNWLREPNLVSEKDSNHPNFIV
jgi:dTDP-4-dehydrorhamnose 3,5-epimerase